MSIFLGIDAVDIERMGRMIDLSPDAFGNLGWTAAEREYCAGRPERFAARWAVKEAVVKALGCGFAGAPPNQIEVLGKEDSPPHLQLHGAALTASDNAGVGEWSVSITHERGLAIAVVVGTPKE